MVFRKLVEKIFIVVEDAYAPYALERILKRYNVDISKIEIRHLMVCSSKMARIVKGHIKAGNHVIIIVDAEYESSREKEQWVRQKHGLCDQVDIIVVDPCIEAIACEALGLRGCRDKPCDNGPLRAINIYWHRKYGKDYDKRFLASLMLEADREGCLGSVPEFNMLLRIVRARILRS